MNLFEKSQKSFSEKKEKELKIESKEELIDLARQKTEKLIEKIENKIFVNSSERKEQIFFEDLTDQILETVNFIQGTKIEPRLFGDKEKKEEENSQKIILSIFRHDIGNKLTALFSAVNLLKLGEEEYDQLFVLEEMKKQIQQTKNLLKEVEKLEESIISGKFILQDVGKVSKEIQSVYGDLKIEVNKENYDKPLIKTSFSFYSILDNLVSNAIRHGKASEIDIKIKTKDNFLLMEIKNNGSRLKDGIEEKIFEKGFKDEKTGNSGLGLAMVRENIQKN
ncbi:MAG TPA: HAMP domain-containing sensor histidine kinase, partial [Candidatus Nanoarchaeia archaeon]|nr:HAMP domain-containing sensor histidine kinase [Candidatus Nanoarchaeia archaeon]